MQQIDRHILLNYCVLGSAAQRSQVRIIGPESERASAAHNAHTHTTNNRGKRGPPAQAAAPPTAPLRRPSRARVAPSGSSKRMNSSCVISYARRVSCVMSEYRARNGLGQWVSAGAEVGRIRDAFRAGAAEHGDDERRSVWWVWSERPSAFPQQREAALKEQPARPLGPRGPHRGHAGAVRVPPGAAARARRPPRAARGALAGGRCVCFEEDHTWARRGLILMAEGKKKRPRLLNGIFVSNLWGEFIRMMKSRRGKLSHHHNVANSRNANPTVADASQRNFIDVFVLRWPAGQQQNKHIGARPRIVFSVSRVIAPFRIHETHVSLFWAREGWNYCLCVRFQGFLAVQKSRVVQKTHYASLSQSRDNRPRAIRADGEQRIRQFVAHEENALEKAHYQFNGHSPLNPLSFAT